MTINIIVDILGRVDFYDRNRPYALFIIVIALPYNYNHRLLNNPITKSSAVGRDGNWEETGFEHAV